MKISNLIDAKEIEIMPHQTYQNLFNELAKEFSQHGKILTLFIIHPKIASLGGIIPNYSL